MLRLANGQFGRVFCDSVWIPTAVSFDLDEQWVGWRDGDTSGRLHGHIEVECLNVAEWGAGVVVRYDLIDTTAAYIAWCLEG